MVHDNISENEELKNFDFTVVYVSYVSSMYVYTSDGRIAAHVDCYDMGVDAKGLNECEDIHVTQNPGPFGG